MDSENRDKKKTRIEEYIDRLAQNSRVTVVNTTRPGEALIVVGGIHPDSSTGRKNRDKED